DGSRARYPVLYLLHGAGGDAAEWTEAVKIQKIADQAIRDGIIPPAVIVMPECRGCWWIDSPRANMETALVADLLPAIAARFRTIEGREGR
ncbi:alpha/beta hydrolase-fold protein, partial [Acinetobacter baumannii]